MSSELRVSSVVSSRCNQLAQIVHLTCVTRDDRAVRDTCYRDRRFTVVPVCPSDVVVHLRFLVVIPATTNNTTTKRNVAAKI